MKFKSSGVILALALIAASCAGESQSTPAADDMTDRNKEIARQFYENLWFSDNTGAYADYVADTYVVHDIFDRKNITEPAVEQKNIADRLHRMGELSGRMDYQIAEGDKVANRWFISFEPAPEAAAMGMTPLENIAIINVMRFNDDGKIVEFWNHRHDIELPRPPDADGPDAEE